VEINNMKCRILYFPNKSIKIIHPVPKSQRPGETEDAWLNRVFGKAMSHAGGYSDYEDVDTSVLPKTREHRGAWEKEKGGSLVINETKKQAVIDVREEAKNIEKELKIMAKERIDAKKIKQ